MTDLMKGVWNDIRLIKYAMILIAALVIVVLLLSQTAFAYEVEMNLRYNIGSNDEIYVNGLRQTNEGNWTGLEKKYIASQDSGNVAGLVFAGSLFNSILLKLHGSDYTFKLSQDDDDNRFIIVLTNGSFTNIDNKYESVGSLLSTSFGYAISKSVNFPVFLQLQYDNIDITNTVFWQGQKTVQVTNEGKNNRGITKVSIKQVR